MPTSTILAAGAAIPAGTNVIGHVITDSSSTTSVTGTVTISGNKTGNAGVPDGTNLGVLPSIANASAPTWIEGDQVLLSQDLSGNLRSTVTNVVSIFGTKTNNAAAPTATNLGVLSALANAANPAWTEGNLVLESVDLSGHQRINANKWGGTLLGTPTNFGTTPGAVIAGSVNSSLFIGTTVAVASSAGVQKVGITGNAAATLDSTIGAATAPTNAIAVSAVYQSTTPVLTTGQAVANQCDTTGSLYANAEGRKATYRAAIGQTTAIAQGTSSPVMTLKGSATTTVRITRIRYGGWSAATGANVTAFLRRYSVMTPGTAATMTAAKMDANDANATAVAQNWTAAATSTATALLASDAFSIPTTAVTQVDPFVDYSFGTIPGARELVLRGTSDWIGISFSAVGTTPTALAGGWIEWTEE
jgi:hypothetical protein